LSKDQRKSELEWSHHEKAKRNQEEAVKRKVTLAYMYLMDFRLSRNGKDKCLNKDSINRQNILKVKFNVYYTMPT
jgi:hypothetical protein